MLTSDKTYLNIVLFTSLFYIIYLLYIRQNISLLKDWKNIKCNPLNLFLLSFLTDDLESNKLFNECINKSASKIIDEKRVLFENDINNIESNISELSTDMTNKNNEINNSINNLDITNNNISSRIAQINERQQSNQTLLSSYGTMNNINNFTTKINDIFNNIRTYINNNNINNLV
jgi:hypothetical protein